MAPCPKCKEGKVCENPKAYGCSRYRQGCDFTIWKTVAKKKLSEKQVRLLIANGHTDKIKGFTSRTGKKFAAQLKFDGGFKVVFDFDEGPRNGSHGRSGGAPGQPATDGDSGPPPVASDPGPPPPIEGDPGPPLARAESAPPSPRRETASEVVTCPKCNQGQIIEGQRGFGCNRYREGCAFVVWKEMASKPHWRQV